ncbi:MAG: hypothetical protein U1F57_03455 [bacterium]
MKKRFLPFLFLLFLFTKNAASLEPGKAGSAANSRTTFGLNLVKEEASGTLYHDPRGNADVFVPKGYQFALPVSNKQVSYNFGLKNQTRPYEVRLRFDPLSPTLQEHAACEKKNKERPGSCVMVNPDKMTPVWAQTMLMNLDGGKPGNFESFPEKAVKLEFGADWGYTSGVFELKDRDFAGSYRQGQIVQIHKNGVGTYTIFFLFQDPKTHLDVFQKIFHLVKFKS